MGQSSEDGGGKLRGIPKTSLWEEIFQSKTNIHLDNYGRIDDSRHSNNQMYVLQAGGNLPEGEKGCLMYDMYITTTIQNHHPNFI